MWPMYLQSWKLLGPMVKEMHYQKYIIWPWPQGQGGQGHTKCCPVPSASCDLWTSKVWCCYIPWLKRRYIYKKIHDLTLTPRPRSHECCLVPSTSCDLCTSKVWYCYIPRLRRGCIYKKIHNLTRDLWVKVTRNVAQCSLHHVPYAPTEVEVTTSKGLEGDVFTIKFNIWLLTLTLGSRSHKMLPSTLYIMWPVQLQNFWSCYFSWLRRRYIYK